MRDLRYQTFLKAAELGNLTKTAELLGYTQPAVSRMISELEKEWGITLFTRSRTGVCLTSDGEYLLPHIRMVCNAQSNLEEHTIRM